MNGKEVALILGIVEEAVRYSIDRLTALELSDKEKAALVTLDVASRILGEVPPMVEDGEETRQPIYDAMEAISQKAFGMSTEDLAENFTWGY